MQRKEKKEKALQRAAQMHRTEEVLTTRTRTRKTRIDYTFDEYDALLETDDEDFLIDSDTPRPKKQKAKTIIPHNFNTRSAIKKAESVEPEAQNGIENDHIIDDTQNNILAYEGEIDVIQ